MQGQAKAGRVWREGVLGPSRQGGRTSCWGSTETPRMAVLDILPPVTPTHAGFRSADASTPSPQLPTHLGSQVFCRGSPDLSKLSLRIRAPHPRGGLAEPLPIPLLPGQSPGPRSTICPSPWRLASGGKGRGPWLTSSGPAPAPTPLTRPLASSIVSATPLSGAGNGEVSRFSRALRTPPPHCSLG